MCYCLIQTDISNEILRVDKSVQVNFDAIESNTLNIHNTMIEDISCMYNFRFLIQKFCIPIAIFFCQFIKLNF